MTTIVSLVAGSGDTSLTPTLPTFGLSDLTHFYHPISFEDGGSSWSDSLGAISLPVEGDTSINQVSESSRPAVRLTTTASFFPGTVFPTAEVGSVFVVAKIGATDGRGGTAGYILHNGASGIAHNTTGSTTITLTNGASGATAALDVWHLFSISTPSSTKISRFTVDDNSFTASGAATLFPTTLRLGGNNTTNHKQYTIAAAFATASDIAAATITDTVYPAVKAWWPEFTWP
jgi:hypothetical protein